MKRHFCGFLLSLLFLSGCGFGAGMEERAVVQKMAIDQEAEGVRVSVSLLTESEEEILSQEGETIADAVSALEKKLGKTLFLRDTQLILLGEELCEEGVGVCRRYLTDGFEIRPRAALAAVTGDAKEYLAAAETLLPVLRWSSDAQGTGITILELDRDMKASGGDGYLPLLTLDANGEAELSGGIILKNEKTSHRLRQEEMNDMMLLLREAGEETMVLSLEDGQAVIAFDEREIRLQARVVANIPTFTLSWSGGFEVKEWTGRGEHPQKEVLEEEARQEIKRRLENALHNSVFEAGADLMQLDSTLRRDEPRWYGRHEDFWREDREMAVFYPEIQCRLEER